MSVNIVIEGETIITASDKIDAAVAIDGEKIAAVGVAHRVVLPD